MAWTLTEHSFILSFSHSFIIFQSFQRYTFSCATNIITYIVDREPRVIGRKSEIPFTRPPHQTWTVHPQSDISFLIPLLLSSAHHNTQTTPCLNQISNNLSPSTTAEPIFAMPSANFEAAAKAAKQLKAKPTDDELLQVGLCFPTPVNSRCHTSTFNAWAGRLPSPT